MNVRLWKYVKICLNLCRLRSHCYFNVENVKLSLSQFLQNNLPFPFYASRVVNLAIFFFYKFLLCSVNSETILPKLKINWTSFSHSRQNTNTFFSIDVTWRDLVIIEKCSKYLLTYIKDQKLKLGWRWHVRIMRYFVREDSMVWVS